MQRMDQEAINREHKLARYVRIVERFAEEVGKLIKQQEALKKERRNIVSARTPDKGKMVNWNERAIAWRNLQFGALRKMRAKEHEVLTELSDMLSRLEENERSAFENKKNQIKRAFKKEYLRLRSRNLDEIQ